jgi:hypothetical protein
MMLFRWVVECPATSNDERFANSNSLVTPSVNPNRSAASGGIPITLTSMGIEQRLAVKRNGCPFLVDPPVTVRSSLPKWGKTKEFEEISGLH